MTSTCNWLTLTTTPVADNTSSEVGHGESWPENSWQTVQKKLYKLQCKRMSTSTSNLSHVRLNFDTKWQGANEGE